jgi:hypothetical protein
MRLLQPKLETNNAYRKTLKIKTCIYDDTEFHVYGLWLLRVVYSIHCEKQTLATSFHTIKNIEYGSWDQESVCLVILY